MWKGPGEDPGGGTNEGPPSTNQPSSQAYTDLKEQYEQQQVLLAQLKEVIRKTEQPVTQEKVEEYANTLSKMNARAKRNKLRRDSEASQQTTANIRTVDTPATERVNLLRQQLEETKAKLAERGKSQKGIEEMVTQLKAQMDDSQQSFSLPSQLNLYVSEAKIEYNENTTSKELYNILLSKEKRLAELNNKVQKLEGNVLDLQENLKEKDSVIDARTKAISLMTENLSKKGKTTLDSLDDTREQMRKMQEDFVKMEAEMKARQLKLLDDLKQKNLEIAELQDMNNCLITEKNLLKEELLDKYEIIEKYEVNKDSTDNTKDDNLSSENNHKEEIEKLNNKIKELEEINASLSQKSSSEPLRSSPQRSVNKKNKRGQKVKSKIVENVSEINYELKTVELQQLLDTQSSENTKKILDLENTIAQLNENIAQLQAKEERYSVESEDITKLKKQFEESNKNMIKVKAQNKSKIKELSKQIDAFKKVSDVHAEVVKLEAEKAKLHQKIAELEEEKGNLQLKLVETDSSKDSGDAETLKELEENLALKMKELDERNLTINKLENEIEVSKAEVDTLKEKLNSLSHLQNAQVTSEMTSIQFEEQLDKVEQEKTSLLKEKLLILKEKDELFEKLEYLQKEKLELNSKLESYIQENMELMDKLEKLSAEKVSSAESIEIVEGLTQQEKLEIEHLQKNLDVATGNLKTSEENLDQEQNADLNETVNQLTEETSELLQKIELFTVERREVMDKMEVLTNENNQLTFKIKEIENNRDILIETYEQLQTEKETLDVKLEELTKENINLKIQVDVNSAQTETVASKNEALVKLASLEKQYEDILEENNNLKTALKEKNESVQEKDCLEVEIKDAQEMITEFETKIRTNLEEIKNYQDIIEENKTELITSSNMIQSLQNNIQEKDYEVKHLTSVITDLNKAIENLETENKDNVNSNQTIENQLLELKRVLNENLEQTRDYEKELEQNSETITNLNKELKQMSNKILETEHLLSSKDDDIKKLTKERDNKETVIANLQDQIKQKDEAFHKLKNELSEKYITLHKQMEASSGSFEEIRIPLENKIDELTNKNKDQQIKMKKLAANLKKKVQAYQELEIKLKEETEKFENEIKESKTQLHELEIINVDLQNKILAIKSKEEVCSTEISLKQEMLGSIHENTPTTDLNDSFASKIQELEMIKESQEIELNKYQERTNKLEEAVAFNEDTRVNLEQQIQNLELQLETKLKTFEEMSQSESVLEQSLEQLKVHNEEIEKKLQEVVKENHDIKEQSKQIHNKNIKLKQKLVVVQEKVNELSIKTNLIDNLEQTNVELNKKIIHLENDLKHVQNELSLSLNEHKNELERLDNDWQMQFNVLLKEKNELIVTVEKLDEQLKELLEKESSVSEELNEYKQRFEENNNELLQLQTELNNNVLANEQLKSQINALQEENYTLKEQSELNSIKQQLNESKLELENAKSELNIMHNEATILKETIQTLKNNELEKTAHQTVENIVNSAQEKLNIKTEGGEQELFPTFQWNIQQSEDPFAFVQEQPVAALQEVQLKQEPADVNVNTDREELLQKIKTLEFMLYNVEKDKEEAVLQCHELSNELTRLVYERETAPKQENLEEQILQSTDIIDATTKQMHEIEFTKTNLNTFNRDESVQKPVEEELAQSKSAYLCYKDQQQPSVESQILSEATLPTAETLRGLQQIEYQQTTPYVGATQQPVLEQPLQSQNAYLCYKTENKPQNISVDTFGEDDDGWGFTPEEAKLEEAHSLNINAPLNQIEELNQKIRVLEIEKESHLNEIKQLQIKSGKLIRKLKELKARNEQLNSQSKSKSEGDFFNLDDTIQEELKSQIDKLEKQIKDVTNELHKEKTEKNSLLKKIEVVTAANERMIDMKEKQDIEMLSWQRQNRDLHEKLQQYEWGDDGFGKPAQQIKVANTNTTNKVTESDIESLQKQVAELTETMKDLMCDNEELQSLLEEQRTLRMNAEKSKSIEPIPENMKTESEYMQILNERNNLHQKLEQTSAEKKHLQDELNKLIKKNDEQTIKINEIDEENNKLNMCLVEKNNILDELNNKLENLQKEYTLIQQSFGENQENTQIISQLNQQIQNLLEEKISSEKELENNNQIIFEKNSYIGNLEDKLHDLQLKHDSFMNSLQQTKEDESNILSEYKEQLKIVHQEKDKLFKELQEKTTQAAEIEMTLNEKIVKLKSELEEQTKLAQDLLEQNKKYLEGTIKSSEIEEQLANKEFEFAATIQQLNQEWESRVDQRGSDVAESWKLHLDSRETEFSQLQQILKQEILELEEKCNCLVNENNELRKNVDTEIRNEVDRISALQKQINDRQVMINEITQKYDEKVLENQRLQEELKNYTTQLADLQVVLQEKEATILNQVTQLNVSQECLQNIISQLQRKCSSDLSNNYDLIPKELQKQIEEYENEITSSKHLLEEKRTLDLSSQDDLLKKQEELHTAKLNLEEFKTKFDKILESHSTLENVILEKDNQIIALTNEADNKQATEINSTQQLEQSLSEYQQHYNAINLQLQEATNQIQNYQRFLEEKTSEINALKLENEESKTQLQNFTELIERKTFEIENIKGELLTKEEQLNYALENANLQTNAALAEQLQEIDSLKKHISETETSYEEILLQKDHAVESIKLQLQELPAKIEECNNLQTIINNKDQYIQEIESKLAEQTALVNEDTKQLEELKYIIEEQVIKIEEQKKELFEKSKNYDSLIAEIDLRRQPPDQAGFKNVEKTIALAASSSQALDEEDLSEPVRRAELDLALYMLHQRDVRCEELTVELTQLLEERDTLQLRLSNAIREKEQIKARYDLDSSVTSEESATTAGTEVIKSSPKSGLPKSKTSAIILGATQTELATDALEQQTSDPSDSLASKLSELKSVSYKRDKTLVDEQDLRRLQQLSIMQQHREDASKLPPEAAARLVDASYTLSRDVQSPSKVLMNWLWGRSTPKVNDI